MYSNHRNLRYSSYGGYETNHGGNHGYYSSRDTRPVHGGYHGRRTTLPNWYWDFMRTWAHKPKPLPAPEEPAEEPVEKEEEKKVLKIKKTDLCIDENCTAHHTDKYELCNPEREYDDDGKPIEQQLVLRRGQDFDIELTFDRDYDKEQDDLKLILEFDCKAPRERDGTRKLLPYVDESTESAKTDEPRMVKLAGKTARIRMKFSPSCLVGRWKLILQVNFKNKDSKRETFEFNIGKIYVLFNAWCKDDMCFLNDDELCKEYVLNDTTILYKGNYYWIDEKKWSLAQFEDYVLPGVLDMLDECDIRQANRSNSIYVTRWLSSLMNSNDNDGVLAGAWPTGEGQFGYGWPDGTKPMDWNGSGKILEQYFQTKKPVNYGQCWVFSGILTTVCRTLGIPCRCVTNYESAHDSSSNITIDVYFDKDNKRLGGDSIWNFHVWNEAWMSRADLKEGYGGWQAIDSTPQEPSDGLFTCGPCPIAAIKRGDIDTTYDAPFVFSEVNADKIIWEQTDDKDGSGRNFEVAAIKKTAVGKNISTKMPGNNKRQDLTKEYKFPEGSEEERAAVHVAVEKQSLSNYASVYGAKEDPDVTFELVDIDQLKMGEDLKIKLKVKNTSNDWRTIGVSITLSTMYYTGVTAQVVKIEGFEVPLKGQEDDVVVLEVPEEEYREKLVEMCHLRVTSIGRVKETKQTFFAEDTVVLIKPSLAVKAPDTAIIVEEFTFEVTFKNPLKYPMTKVVLSMESPGMQKVKYEDHPPIGPHEELTRKFTMTAPKKQGEREIIVSLTSLQLYEIAGSDTINIVAPAGTMRPR